MSTLSLSHDDFDVVELAPFVPGTSGHAAQPLREMPFRHDAWTPQETDALKDLFGADEPLQAISERLDRPLHSVRSKIHALGLRRNSTREWTDLDDAELARRYGNEATATIARDLGRSCSAVYVRAQILELTEPQPPEWTEWEDAQLRAGYTRATDVSQIAAIIGRPVSGTASRASKLGLKHPSNPAGWTEPEICRALELLDTGIAYRDAIEIMVNEGFPRRSKAGFGPKIRAAGYTRGWGRAWLPEEDALLRKAYATGASLTPLRTRLGRTRHSIKWRAEHLGLTGSHSAKNGFRGGPDWTDADIASLKAHYGTMSNAALARFLGRSKLAISTRANVLGLVHGYIRPWSDDELRALQVAYENEIAIADLAGALGRKPMSVSKFATKHGLHFGRRPRTTPAPSIETILALDEGGGGGMPGINQTRRNPVKYEPIRASVSPDTIGKVTRLFNGSLSDILNELLQNARRAGASAVNVDATPRENGLRITIDDDGCGIDDPARVLALGASRWDAQVASAEDPAGMGVFSLAGKATVIESRSDSTGSAWRIAIPADAWTGDVEIAVDRSERRKGTSISFLLPGACEGSVENAVREASQYFPIPVRFAGRDMPRKDFLSGAIHVEDWNGSRIGIFHGRPYHRTPTVNFHGVTVFTRLFEVAQVGRQEIHARIDIGHTPELQLVLPARKEFVENAGLTTLKAACEVACYRAIAAQKSHSLSFESYSRAASLGIPLAEAEAALTAWEPDIADNDTGTEAGERRTITGDEFLMDAHEAHFGQIIARALRGTPIRSKLVDRNSRFEGYSWYDALREMRDPNFVVRTDAAIHTVDAIAADPPLAAVTIAQEIHLEYAIDDQGCDGAARERVEADIVLTFPDGCCSDGIEDVTIAYVASDALQPEGLVALLDNACFSAWNDSDADSWDTQHDRFLRDARELAYRILIGEDAAIASQFRDAIARIMWTLPKGKKVTIAFTHDSPIDVTVCDQEQAT